MSCTRKLRNKDCSQVFILFFLEKPTKLTPAELTRLRRQKKQEIKRERQKIYRARYRAKKKAKEAELAAKNAPPIEVNIETEPRVLTKEERRREQKRLWIRKKRAEEKLKKQRAEARREKSRIYKQMKRQEERLAWEASLQSIGSYSSYDSGQTEWVEEGTPPERQSVGSFSDSDFIVKEEQHSRNNVKVESESISLNLSTDLGESAAPVIKEEILDNT